MQLWRHTGHLVSGETNTVTFDFSKALTIPDPVDDEFVDRIRGMAALGAMRGLMTNFCNTLKIELSENDGATWRTVYEWPD